MRREFLWAIMVASSLIATEVHAGCQGLDQKALDMRLVVTDVSTSERGAYLNPMGTGLHVVIASGGSDKARTLTVRRTEEPIAVMLITGAGVWRVAVEDGARLSRLMVVGRREDVEVHGVPPDIKTEWLGGECVGGSHGWPNGHDVDFLRSLAGMRAIAGQVEASYQEVQRDTAIVPPPASDPPGRQVAIPAVGPESVQARPFARPEDLIAFLKRAIERKVLPAEVPRALAHPYPYYFKPLLPSDLNTEEAQRVRTDIDCSGILQGTAGRDMIRCVRGEAVYFAGAGDDVIESSWGYQVVDGGPGSDEFRLSSNTAVAVFTLGWGHDRLSKSCGGGQYDADSTLGAERNPDFTYPWVNFVLFGEGIKPDDLEWSTERTLRHRTNGDELNLTEGCWNAVFFDVPGTVWNLQADMDRKRKDEMERQRAAEMEKRKAMPEEDREAAARDQMLRFFRKLSDETAIQQIHMRTSTLMNDDGDYRDLTMEKTVAVGPGRVPIQEMPAVVQQRLTVLPPGEAECQPARVTDYCIRLRPAGREDCEKLLTKPLGQNGTRVGTAAMVDSISPVRQAFPRDACESAPAITWRF